MSKNRVPVTPVYDNGPDRKFLEMLKNGEHLKFVSDGTPTTDAMAKKARGISEKYPFKPE